MKKEIANQLIDNQGECIDISCESCPINPIETENTGPCLCRDRARVVEIAKEILEEKNG